MNESMPGSQKVEVEGLSVHYHVMGPEKGRPLVLLHGYISSAYSWRSVWRKLSGPFRLYIPDLPGYGASAAPQEAWTVDSYARFLDRFFAAAGLERASVVGAQMGGSIAAGFAARHPGRVDKLVLMAAGGMGEERTNMWLYKLVSSPVVGAAIVRSFPRRMFARRLRAGYVRKDVADDEVVNTYFDAFKKTGHIQTRLGLQVRESYGRDFKRFGQLVKQIVSPTLLIWGENDPLVPLSTGRKFEEAITGAKLVTIANCGDFPHEEYPDEVSSYILNFILNR